MRMLRRPARRPLRQDERGAVLVIVAIFSVVMLVAAGFAVDIGSEVETNRALQAEVDAAAMDGATMLTGLPGSNLDLQNAVAAVVSQSLARNRYTCHSLTVNGNSIPSVAGVDLCPSIDPSNDVTVSVGGWQPGATVDQTAGSADAVQVNLDGLTSFGFGRITGKSSQVSTRVAAALNSSTNTSCASTGSCVVPNCAADNGKVSCSTPFQPISGIAISSALANINTQRSALIGALLGNLAPGTSTDLTVLGSSGLLSLNLSLLDLLKASTHVLGVNSVANIQQLMVASLPVNQLLQIMMQAADQANPGLNSGLNSLLPPTALAGLTATTQLCKAVVLGGGLAGPPPCPTSSDQLPPDAALAQVSALGLLQTVLEVANGTNGLDLTTTFGRSLAGSFGGVVPSVTASLKLIQPPQIAAPGPVGHVQVSTAQLDLTVDVKILGLDLTVSTTAAQATATLTAISCPSAPSAEGSTTAVHVNAAAADLGTSSAPGVTLQLPPLLLLPLGTVTAYGTVGGYQQDLHFAYPFGPTNTQTTATQQLNVNLTTGGSGLVGLVGSVLSAATTLISPSFLGNLLIGPLLSALGVDLAQANITDYYTACGPQVTLVH